MNLIKTVVSDRMKASKEEKPILTLLLGEIDRVWKREDVIDKDVIATIKKLIKGIDETYSLTKDEKECEKLSLERKVLEKYLPRQLTDGEIRGIILTLVGDGDSLEPLGVVMMHMKKKYEGLWDGRNVTNIYKQLEGTTYG